MWFERVRLQNLSIAHLKFKRLYTIFGAELRSLTCILISLFPLFWAADRAFGQAGGEAKEVVVEADSIEYLRAGNFVVATGGVKVGYGKISVSANKVSLDIDTGEAIAEGEVTVEEEGNIFKADKAILNVASELGTTFNVVAHIAPTYVITGEKLEKLGPRRYRIFGGTFTTCDCGEKVPSWQFKLREGTLEVERYAVLRGVSFAIKDQPIVYTPLMVVPVKTKRATGLLPPRLGLSNRDGLTAENSFFWAISESSDATFGLDYLSRRGLRPNFEYRYVLSERAQGRFKGYFLDDKLTDIEFFKINYAHTHHLPSGFYAMLNLDIENVENFDREFERDDLFLRTRRDADSFLHLRRNWDTRSFQMISEFLMNIERDSGIRPEREGSFGRMPQVSYIDDLGRLGQSPLRYNFALSFTNFFEADSATNTVQRLDIFSQLILPMTNRPWLTFTPAIGLRETAYNNSLDAFDEDINRNGILDRGEDLNGNGRLDRNFSSQLAFSRELFELDARLNGPIVSRVFDVGRGRISKIKHIFEPRLDYLFVSEFDKNDSSRVLPFDEVDIFDRDRLARDVIGRNTVSYSIVNRLLAKEAIGGGAFAARQILRFEVGQEFNIKESIENNISGVSPFREIFFDLDSHLIPSVILNLDGSFSVDREELTQSSIELRLRPPWRVYFDFDRFFAKDSADFLVGTLGLNLTDLAKSAGLALAKKFELAYSARYDNLRKEFFENKVVAKYESCCWGLELSLIDRIDETIVSVSFSLKELGTFGG